MIGSIRDLRLILMPVSTRVHEAGVVARLIGRLETDIVETVYARVDARHHCPTQQPNCTDASSFASHSLLPDCVNRTSHETFDRAPANAGSSSFVAMATDDAVSHVMRENVVWDQLSQQSRDVLRSLRPSRAADIVNASTLAFIADYSVVVDELTSLLPVPSRDVILPRALLRVGTETSLFASVSGLLSLAYARRATASQCLLGHVFYACGHLAADERFYFRSNRSRAESELRDVRYRYSDSTTDDVRECQQRVLATMSSSVEQSRGCTTADDVRRWYSACEEMLNGTNRLVETLIARLQERVAEAWRCCLLEIVIYALLICLQVCFLFILSTYFCIVINRKT